MKSLSALPIDRILDTREIQDLGLVVGKSSEDRAIHGYVFGTGPVNVSLIGGCHADEPVGPAMLAKLAAFLDSIASRHPLLTAITWRLVPHVNPDGRARNESWTHSTRPADDYLGKIDSGYELDTYLRHVVRELPGDDIEFGFPTSSVDDRARPENLAVADFLAPGAPFHLHGSFHGMGFAPGPWFLIEASWIDRTGSLRETMREHVQAMGYGLFDPDRKGEKGFTRIDSGFCTRPDSRAMSAHFTALDDPLTASRFRPSSMEFVGALGGDPFTFVSEMPLFLTPPDFSGKSVGLPELRLIRRLLDEQVEDGNSCDAVARKIGVRPMAIRDQQRLQLHLLDESLRIVRSHRQRR